MLLLLIMIITLPAAVLPQEDTVKDTVKFTYVLPEISVVSTSEHQLVGQVRIKERDILNTPSAILPDPLRLITVFPFVDVEDELFPVNLFIKGGRPEENAVFIEDFPVISPYHFGFTTILPLTAIDYYDFYTLDMPPYLSTSMTSAINFHLVTKRSKNIYIDPTSSLSFAMYNNNLFKSFRFTTLSLPIMLAYKKYIQYFWDIALKYKMDKNRNVVLFAGYDKYQDSYVENIDYHNFSLTLGAHVSSVSGLYLGADFFISHDLKDTMDLARLKKIIIGYTFKRLRISDRISLYSGFQFLKPIIKLRTLSETDSLWIKRVNTEPYIRTYFSFVYIPFMSLKLYSGANIYLDKNKKFAVFTPKMSYTLLKLGDTSFLKVSAGINSQFESAVSLLPVKVRFKNTFPMQSIYLQGELFGNKSNAGVFYRYYPSIYFMRECAYEFMDEGEKCTEIIDTLVFARKRVIGAYLSFHKDIKKLSLWGDFSYMKASITENEGISYQMPFTSDFSGKFFAQLHMSRKIDLNITAIGRSNVIQPVFYALRGEDIICYSKPIIKSLGPYFRLDAGLTIHIRVFKRKGLLSTGLYNIIFRKPEVSDIYDKTYLKFPVPYAGLEVNL